MILFLDFETFSACDLKTAGLDNYARHPSTGVHCMAFAFDDEPVELATSMNGICDYGCPKRVRHHVESGGLVYAHNAPFEWAIWNHAMVPRYGWPELQIEQLRCTMAMAYAMGLPGALEAAAPTLGIPQRKDSVGKRIMLTWCKPKADGTFWRPEDDPPKFQALCDYCKQDVVVERALHHRLMELSPSEQALWALDHRINQRGVLVDLSSIDKAIRLVNDERRRLDQGMLKTTGGVVGSCTEVQLLVKWIRSQGVEVPGLAKADVLDALSGDLPANVRQALELRKEAAKSSTAKLAAMKERATSDGRVRGIHQFHGAGTGRWAGRGIQPQNLARPRATTRQKDIEDIFAHLDNRAYVDALYGPIMDAMADCVRGMIVAPPGKDLIACDFSAVEARVLAWLAGDEETLEIFRTHGKIYEHAAAGIYRVPMKEIGKHDPRRQIGKVAVLALGYQGGVGAFQSMARNYNVKVKDEEADKIKVAWREAHPEIVRYWYAIEDTALGAVRSGLTCATGPKGREVAFRKKGSFLWCKLPSSRVLCYPYPELRTITTPWGEEKEALTYTTVVSNIKAKILEDPHASGTWKRIATYGGSLVENVTQAVARDLLAEAMVRLEAAGYPIHMHVHDEVVTEVTESVADFATKTEDRDLMRVESLMSEVPNWATGLPLAAEGWRGKRYRK